MTRVTIIGAGMAGLTLARVLHRNGVEAVVYDADASAGARHQGGMLDIHEESGQAALAAAGLLEALGGLTLEGGDALRVLDAGGRVWREEAGNGERPEVARGALRGLLLGSLPDGMVRWGARVVGVARAGAGFALSFADGASATAELLVGADGAWSKVRPLVSAAVPAYCGVSFVEMRFLDADRRHPVAAGVVGQGTLMALSGGRGMLGHREPDGELSVYAALRVPVDRAERAVTREDLHRAFAGWAPAYHAMIDGCDGALAVRPVHALPVGHRWERVPGVTLVGDAAHLMSPFAGEGVNLAMIDGADLAAALLAHPADVEAALAAYEAAMFPRAAEKAAESAANLEIMFAEDAPRGLVAMFEGFAGGPG